MNKIKNVKDLVNAYRIGELTRSDILYLDNDHCFMCKNDETIFSLDMQELICQLLEHCEIPFDGV
jgi:hypothetical protein